MRHANVSSILLVLAAVGGCAPAARPPQAGSYVRALASPEPPPPASPATSSSAALLEPAAPIPEQKRPLPAAHGAGSKRAPAPAQQVVSDANRKASQAPDSSSYFNAIVQYAYEPGTLYQVFAAPMRVTDIALEPGERLLGQPASGDVVRWLLAIGKSMDHGLEQSHVYLKPTRPDLETNLAINTDRRSYLLELHSYADTYMAAVVWRYPEDELARLQAQASDAVATEKASAPVVSLDQLNFAYTIQVIKGAPAWTPLQCFDDGRHTFVRFPPAMLVREAPALFVLRDKETQLVNYRVKGDTYVVDRLIESAELRVGQQEQEIVRIVRGFVPPPSPRPAIHGR
jgi:type IV secretion system protein VirB9